MKSLIAAKIVVIQLCFVTFFSPLECSGNFISNETTNDFSFQSIEQKVDHIDFVTNRTWQMRYLVNEDFYQRGGDVAVSPMFIHIGGQHNLTSSDVSCGYFRHLAKSNNALLFAIEHRYYGESQPFWNLSNENLKYLTIRQVLADIAHFIVEMKKKYYKGFENVKVIMAGCSYGGSLVVWMKHFYPELVTGGWASSAPLLAKLEFPENYVRVSNVIRKMANEECYQKIKNGISQIETTLDSTNVEEMKKVESFFATCPKFSFTNGFDVWSLFLTIATTFTAIVRERLVSSICQSMMSSSDDRNAIARIIIQHSKSFRNGCLDVSYSNSTCDINDIFNLNGRRQYFYQKCNELGQFPTIDPRSEQIFGTKLPIFYYSILCSDAFGGKYTIDYMKSRIDETNKNRIVSNLMAKDIFMTYGEYDQWEGLGMQDKNQIISIIPDEFECSDMATVGEYIKTSEKFRKIQKKLADHIKRLLLEPELNLNSSDYNKYETVNIVN